MMKFLPAVLLALFFSFAGTSCAVMERESVNFNPGWKFIKADRAKAETPQFNDVQRATVSAPHSFNDTGTFDNRSLPGNRGEQERALQCAVPARQVRSDCRLRAVL